MRRQVPLVIGLVVAVMGCIPALVNAQGMELTSARVYLQQTPPLYDKALDLLNQAVAKHPENNDVHFLLGYIYSQTRKEDQAVKEWEHVDPTKLGKKERKMYDDEYKQLFVNLFNSGGKLFSAEKFEEAATKFEMASRLNPKDPLVFINQGVALLNAQKAGEGINALLKGLELDPKNVTAWGALANAYKSQENYKKMIEAYNNYVPLKTDNPGAYFNLANGYLATGDTTKAIETFETGIKMNPQNPLIINLYLDLSVCYFKSKQYDKVSDLLQKARMLKPDDADVLLNLGIAYYSMKRFTEAIEPLEAHLKVVPNSIDGWETLGNVYLGMANIETDPAKIKEYEQKGTANIRKAKELVKTGEGK